MPGRCAPICSRPPPAPAASGPRSPTATRSPPRRELARLQEPRPAPPTAPPVRCGPSRRDCPPSATTPRRWPWSAGRWPTSPTTACPPIVDAAGQLGRLAASPQARPAAGRRHRGAPGASGAGRRGVRRRRRPASPASRQRPARRRRRPLQDLRDQVSTADDTLAAASRAVNLLPGMLGADGERRFLVVFQNNAEVRSTGGMPGAMSLVETREGRVAMTRQMAASDFPRLTEPVLPLTTDEQTVFGDQLGDVDARHQLHPGLPARRGADGGALAAPVRSGRRRGDLDRPGRPVLPARGHRPGHRGRGRAAPRTTRSTSCSTAPTCGWRTRRPRTSSSGTSPAACSTR